MKKKFTWVRYGRDPGVEIKENFKENFKRGGRGVIVEHRRKRKPAVDAETSAENRKPDVTHE